MTFSLLSAAAAGEGGTPAWAMLAYLVAGVFFILALRGLSSPATSRTGNRNGMIGMAIAVATTLVTHDIANIVEILVAVGIGGAIGVVVARRIAMTAMPELVAGYQVEYSSTPYLLFMIGEYMSIVLMCALTTILFFGGWLSPIPGLPDGFLWFALKVVFFFFLFAMVKAIVPRYRYDQLMRLGWKVFLPMSLGWVVIAATLAQFDVPGYARWATGG